MRPVVWPCFSLPSVSSICLVYFQLWLYHRHWLPAVCSSECFQFGKCSIAHLFLFCYHFQVSMAFHCSSLSLPCRSTRPSCWADVGLSPRKSIRVLSTRAGYSIESQLFAHQLRKCSWKCSNYQLHHRYPYAAVADLIYGKRMRLLVTFLLDLTVFGAGVPNILVGMWEIADD